MGEPWVPLPLVRVAVLTVSDGVSEGTREDRSGDLLASLLAGEGYEVVRRVVADDLDEIAGASPAAPTRNARRSIVDTDSGYHPGRCSST